MKTKRFLSALLTIMMLVSVVFTASTSNVNAGVVEKATVGADFAIADSENTDPSELDGRIIGRLADADMNGAVNIKDATCIQKYAASMIYFNSDQEKVADVNLDAKVNVKDATVVQKWIAGMSISYPANHLVYVPEEGADSGLTPELEKVIKDIEKEANGKTINLTLWGPSRAIEVLEDQADAFSELLSDYVSINIMVKVHEEGDVVGSVLNDPKGSADVFGFPSDSIDRFCDADALAPVLFDDVVEAANEASSVSAVTRDGKLYGYPETADNSYILAYDKRVISAEQAKTFEGILDVCKNSGKNFIMDASNSYFTCMFPFTGGLRTMGFEADGYTQAFNDYDIDQVTSSVKAFAELFKSAGDSFESAITAAITDGFKVGTTAAGIAGSWDIAAIKQVLGDNAGFAVLPTININGVATQAVNMFGYRFIGVNNESEFPVTSQALAHFLTSYECQLQRAEELEWVPTNLEARASDFVTSREYMVALMQQSEFSVPQSGIANTFWAPMDALGRYISDPSNDLSFERIKKEVEECIDNIIDW